MLSRRAILPPMQHGGAPSRVGPARPARPAWEVRRSASQHDFLPIEPRASHTTPCPWPCPGLSIADFSPPMPYLK